MPLHSSTALRVGVALLASALALALLGPRVLLVLLAGLALGWLLKPSRRTSAHPRAPVQAGLDLVGEAAHELGNPLMALQLRLHRLRAHASPDATLHEGLAQAEREVHRLGLMLRDLLDLSRQSSGRLALALEEVDLTALVREVASRFDAQAAATGCALEVFADGPVQGRWDRQRLERVATNLLSNALKFGQGRPVRVHIRTEGPLARLEVCDQGQGIHPEAQRRLFGRFERAGHTLHPGTGLGLYIARQLVEAHGGSIHVSSRPGDGATFSVSLPHLRPLASSHTTSSIYSTL